MKALPSKLPCCNSNGAGERGEPYALACDSDAIPTRAIVSLAAQSFGMCGTTSWWDLSLAVLRSLQRRCTADNRASHFRGRLLLADRLVAANAALNTQENTFAATTSLPFPALCASKEVTDSVVTRGGLHQQSTLAPATIGPSRPVGSSGPYVRLRRSTEKEPYRG